MNAAFRHELGDKVKDRITGLVGLITSRAEHLFGCARYWVQPQETKDGKTIDGQWFDEDSLEIVEAGVVKAKRYRVVDAPAGRVPLVDAQVSRAGGPTDQPSSQTRASER